MRASCGGDGPCAQFGRLDGSVCRLVGEMIYAITFRRVRIACTTWWVWCCRGTHTVFIPLVICSGPRHLDAGFVGMVHTHDLDASTAVCRLVGEMIYAITFSGMRSMHTCRRVVHIRYSHHSLSTRYLLRTTPSRCGHRGGGPCA